MKGIASAICPNCKHYEGMVEDSFYICGVTHSNGGLYHLMGVEDELYCTSFEEVTNMNKVEGKVSDWCPKCKNCKGTTQESNGVHVWLTEVECEDPYDGMTKTLTADSDICCSMFEPKPACEKCERFDGTYCHSPEGIFVTSYMATGNCPSYVEKKETCETKTVREIELEARVAALLREKADHLKGIKRLKKSQEKLQNQVKNLQTTNEESYKREEKLEDKVHKLERRLLEENKRFIRLDTELLIPLAHVLYPREAKICKPYSEVIEDIKRLIDKSEILEQRYDNIHYTLYKDWSDDSISCPRDIPSGVEMIEDLKKRAADSDYYKEKSELLEERNNNQYNTIREKDRKISEMEEKLKKANELNQTISDQEITIKALRITIKEMCKDE